MKEDMRTITVVGKGKLTLPPDTIQVRLELEGLRISYPDAMAASARDTDTLKAEFVKLGFKKLDLKTTRFDIDSEYERYEDDNGNYKSRFIGYKYSHKMKLEFANDNELLSKILYSLANCPVKTEVHFSYTVKDKEGAKNQLLVKSIEDAKEKAAVLTKAAGVTLGAIQSVNYSWGDYNMYVEPMRNLRYDCVCEADGLPMDIEAEDIELDDTVTVVWEIE